MKHHPTLPTFGDIVPGEGGRLGAILRGALVGKKREPDYAVIVPLADLADLKESPWGQRGQDVAGAKSFTDGWRNTLAMAASGCAIATQVRQLTIEGHSDLYIPARAEMWALYANVPELFDKRTYWTSTQSDSHVAYAQDFAYGYSYWGGKVNELRVRAVRRIQLHHFTA
ncbi:MAG: DUF1566 domain-containing protein [Ramlibacter sp.]